MNNLPKKQEEKNDQGGMISSKAVSLGFPFLMVMGYLLVDYGRPQDWLPPLRALHPGMIVLGGGILAFLFMRKHKLPRQGKLMMLFLIVMAMGVPFAYNGHAAFITTKNMALLIFGAVLPIMLFVDSTKKINIVFHFWIGIHILLAIYGITHHGRGVGSFLGDENDFALVINMVFPFAYFLTFTKESFAKKALLGVIILVFLIAVTSSVSRGGFIGLVVVVTFCWWRSPKKILSATIVVVLSVAVYLNTPDSYWKEMESISDATDENDTGHQRLYLWSVAWEMFMDNPIIGVGPSNYQYLNYEYERREEKKRGVHIWGKVSHSLYFTVIPEEGTVGIILFLLLIYYGFKERKQMRVSYKLFAAEHPELLRDNKELTQLYYFSLSVDAALIAFLATGAFLTVLYYPHLWVQTALSSAAVGTFNRKMAALNAELQDDSPVASEQEIGLYK